MSVQHTLVSNMYAIDFGAIVGDCLNSRRAKGRVERSDAAKPIS